MTHPAFPSGSDPLSNQESELEALPVDQLTDEHAAALDSLVQGRFDVDSLPLQAGTVGARLAALLQLLDGPVPSSLAAGVTDDDTLVDLTMARVARQRQSERAVGGELCDSDQDALQALVAAGFDPNHVTHRLRERALKHDALLNLLRTPVPVASMIDSTLRHVQAAIESGEAARRVRSTANEPRAASRPRFRIADAVSLAAAAMLALAVLTPIISTTRDTARRTACASNLSAAGIGFGQYCADSKSVLPLASDSSAGRAWWEVGVDPACSNSANLYTLIRTGYQSAETLACPGNAGARRDLADPADRDWRQLSEVSYSYANMFTANRPSWCGNPAARSGDGSDAGASNFDDRVVLIVDRSPVIIKAKARLSINPLENSPNHLGRGQSVLYNDGSVEFLQTPVLASGDMLWVPEAVERLVHAALDPTRADPLRGTETQQRADDAFLVP